MADRLLDRAQRRKKLRDVAKDMDAMARVSPVPGTPEFTRHAEKIEAKLKDLGIL
jgi:hypothetical protein